MKTPAKPRPDEPIRLVMTSKGMPRYRVRLDAGRNPQTGRRRQVWATHDTLTAARSAVNAHKADVERGSLIAPSRQSFRDYAQHWHETRARRVREITARSYQSCLAHAYTEFGAKPLAQVCRADVEAVVTKLADAGRSKRTASLNLFVLRSVFDDALHDGLIVRNPAARVEPLGRDPRNREALPNADLKKLRRHLVSFA